MKRHAITLAAFAAAVFCYASGWKNGGAALFAVGSVLELIFLSRVFRGSKSSGKSAA